MKQSLFALHQAGTLSLLLSSICTLPWWFWAVCKYTSRNIYYIKTFEYKNKHRLLIFIYMYVCINKRNAWLKNNMESQIWDDEVSS